MLLIGSVILIASLVQGVTGFGFSLVALPLLGKTQFRGNLTVYFLILKLVTIATYFLGA